MQLMAIGILLVAALAWAFRTGIAPDRASLIVTAVIGAATITYALFTYEILVQNERTAEAALRSATLMERSLRFSNSAKLLYETISTKDLTLRSIEDPPTLIENVDLKRARTDFKEDEKQREFIFAVVRNKGQGSATSLSIEATYNITDGSNANRDTSVTKRASVPILEPKKAVALLVSISSVPTPDDRAALVSAHLISGDLYRDALEEPALRVNITPDTHVLSQAADCVVRLA
jgi:hypothetical protein